MYKDALVVRRDEVGVTRLTYRTRLAEAPTPTRSHFHVPSGRCWTGSPLEPTS